MFWFNFKFKDLLGDKENIENITEINPNFPIKSLCEVKDGTINNIDITELSRNYNIIYNVLKEGKFGEGKSYVLYWIDNTAFNNLKNKYNDERPIAMLVQIDNYDEISEKH